METPQSSHGLQTSARLSSVGERSLSWGEDEEENKASQRDSFRIDSREDRL